MIPPHLDHPDAVDFIATVQVRHAVAADGYGTDELSLTPAELLPVWLDQEYEPKQLFAARVDGRIVARATFQTRASAADDVAWVVVQVHPQFRHRGIGTALADHLEILATEQRCTNIVVATASRAAEGRRFESPLVSGRSPAPIPRCDFCWVGGTSSSRWNVSASSPYPFPRRPSTVMSTSPPVALERTTGCTNGPAELPIAGATTWHCCSRA